MSREAVIYARVSSDRQEKEGFSIPAQFELLRDYAAKKGFRVIEEYPEAETAKSSGRPKFNELVNFIRKTPKKIAVLVEKTDRFYRNFKDYLTIDDLVQEKDLEIHLIKEAEVLGQAANSHTKLTHGLKVLLAKNYIDNLSEEVRKGKRQKAMAGGWHTLAPYGYKNDKNIRQIVPNPEAAPFVIRAFQIYGTGLYSIKATSDKLLNEGFLYKPHAQRMPLSRLHEMFKNPIYIGKIQYDGEIYDGIHPPLIDIATWMDVRNALRKDNKPASCMKRDFIYRGVLTCGECGLALVGEIKKGKYVYYRCHAGKEKCSQGYIPEGRLDEEVNAVFSGLVFPTDHKQLMRNAVRDISTLLKNTANDEMDRIASEKKKLRTKRRAAYEDKQAGHLDHELWLEIDQDYQERIHILEAQESRIDVADTNYMTTIDSALELPEIVQRQWICANHEDKKEILNFVTSNFTVMDGKPSLELKKLFQDLRQLPQKEKSREWQEVVRTFLQKYSATIKAMHQALTA